MKLRIIWAIVVLLLLIAGIVYAHDGDYHYAGVAGTAPNTDRTWASMMMPYKPTHCSAPCHVIAWAILWDYGQTGQYVEAGIGYNRNKSKKVTLWWASPQHETMKKVASVPFGTWVDVELFKPAGQEYVEARWSWIGESAGQITKQISTPGWTGNQGYHPTKVEVWSPKGHPGNVEMYLEDVPTFDGDALYWHVEGPWTPEGAFEEFSVR